MKFTIRPNICDGYKDKDIYTGDKREKCTEN